MYRSPRPRTSSLFCRSPSTRAVDLRISTGLRDLRTASVRRGDRGPTDVAPAPRRRGGASLAARSRAGDDRVKLTTRAPHHDAGAYAGSARRPTLVRAGARAVVARGQRVGVNPHAQPRDARSGARGGGGLTIRYARLTGSCHRISAFVHVIAGMWQPMSTEAMIFCSRIKAPELRRLSLRASRERAKLRLALANVVDGQGIVSAARGLGLDPEAVQGEIALLRTRGLPEMAGCLCRERPSNV